MAGGLFSFSRSLPSSSSSSSSSSSIHSYITKLVLFLTILPLGVAVFAFLLHFNRDSVTPNFTVDRHFLGLYGSPPATPASTPTDCGYLLNHSSPSFPYFRNWELHQDPPHLKPNIAITTSTSASLNQILPWIFFHKVIGVTTFYLFVEGKPASPQVSSVLQSIPGVKVIPRTKQLEEQQAKSRIWNETWLANFFYKPCNYELFVKQTLNMEMAIVMARSDGVDWILHLDTDELVHPAGTREYSLREVLLKVPSDVDMVVFSNYEGGVERDDIQDPFTEVSLFKKNYDHLAKDTYDLLYKEATRNNPNFFLTYGNGKAIARIQDDLRPNGAHRWYSYTKTLKEIKLGEAVVLHYTYAKFSDLTSRRARCNCKITKEALQRCFMLEFDRSAYIIASTLTEEQMRHWYREHVVWGDEELKMKLLQKGVLTRIYAPMVIIRAMRESGVFTSVIASASTNVSNHESSSPIVNATNPSTTEASLTPSSNTGDSQTGVPQTITRKLLEVAHVIQYTSQLAAVPPLPPPLLKV